MTPVAIEIAVSCPGDNLIVENEEVLLYIQRASEHGQ